MKNLLVILAMAIGGNSLAQSRQTEEIVQKEYLAATAKIAAENKADMLECGKNEGPAAQACEIQANGKREAAQDRPKVLRDQIGANRPQSDNDRKKAAKQDARIAKITFGMEKARIGKEDKQARARYSELKNNERIACNSAVASRTVEANREAKSNYDRSVDRATRLGAF